MHLGYGKSSYMQKKNLNCVLGYTIKIVWKINYIQRVLGDK